MRKVIRRKLNQYGFSLIEIMVAVAIVGILTVIAIPQYQKYQRRAMQGEAKMLLSNLYTIERTFSLNWGYGATNLPQLGFKATGSVAYNAGWNAGSTRNPIECNTNRQQTVIQGDAKCAGYQGPGHTAPSCVTVSTDKTVNTKNLCPSSCDCVIATTSGLPPVYNTKPVTVDNTKYRGVTFMIGARKKFSNGKEDEWIINHNKRIKNSKSGI